MISTNQRCCACDSDLQLVALDHGGFAAICPACLFRRSEAIHYSASGHSVELRIVVEPPELRRIIFAADRVREVGN